MKYPQNHIEEDMVMTSMTILSEPKIHYEKFKDGFYSMCSWKGKRFTWLLGEVNCKMCLNRLKKYAKEENS